MITENNRCAVRPVFFCILLIKFIFLWIIFLFQNFFLPTANATLSKAIDDGMEHVLSENEGSEIWTNSIKEEETHPRYKRDIIDELIYIEKRPAISDRKRIKHPILVNQNIRCRVGGSTNVCGGHLHIHRGTGLDTKFVFVYERLKDIQNIECDALESGKVDLKSPITPYFRLINIPEDNAIIFMFKSLTSGQHNFTITSKNDTPEQNVHVAVGSSPRLLVPVRITCYLDVVPAYEDPSTEHVKYLVYAPFFGVCPVLDAYVVAHFFPNGKEPVLAHLHDNGMEPDTYRNDGYYTGYLTNFTMPGIYTVKVVASDKYGICHFCITTLKDFEEAQNGKPLDKSKITNVTTGPFNRFATCGMIEIPDFVIEYEKNNPYSPNQITDLQVTAVRYANETEVDLQWTATGGKLDQGRASSYALYYTKDRELLLAENYMDAETAFLGSENPKIAGSTERRTVTASTIKENECLLMGLVACSGSTICSEISNIVMIFGIEHKDSIAYSKPMVNLTLQEFSEFDYNAIAFSDVALDVLLKEAEIEIAATPEPTTEKPESDPEYVFLVSLGTIIFCLMIIAITCFCNCTLYNYFKSRDPNVASDS